MKLKDIRTITIPQVQAKVKDTMKDVMKQLQVPSINPVKVQLKESRMKLEEYTILKKEYQAPYTFLFTLNKCLGGEPGQFVQVSLMPYGEVPISICSCGRKNSQLLIRAVGNVTDAICALEAKDKIWIRGPYGKGYPMEEMKGRDIVVIAGGTGIAPPRSALDYIEKHRKKYGKVRVFLGFRNAEDTWFKDDVDKWKKKFETNITVDAPDENWKGPVGVVTKILEDKNFCEKWFAPSARTL